MAEKEFAKIMETLKDTDIGAIIVQWYLRQEDTESVRVKNDESRVIVWHTDGSRTVLHSEIEDNSGVTWTKEDL